MNTNATPSDILLTPEASIYIRAGESTLEKWRLRGDGPPFIRIGSRKIGYLRADLDQWLASRRRGSTSEPTR
jgi:predicted DNA-binding transcriptional regulator AlpA